MVFGDGPGKSGAGFRKKFGPLLGVKPLGFEHGHELVVPEFGRIAILLNVVRVLPAVLLVHVPRIPLTAKRGHAVNTPMEIDPVLGIAKPLGRGIVLRK